MADLQIQNSSYSRKTVLAVGLLAFVLGLSLVRCSNDNDHQKIEPAHTERWIDPTLKGDNAYHATYVGINGTESCQTCHGTDLNGAEDAPGCSNACHFSPDGDYSPPGSGWEHAVNPHNALLQHESVCNECHSTMRDHGLGPPECHDCHDIAINHITGRAWLDPKTSEFHGRSTLDCAACHNLATDCGQCHFGSSGSRAPAGSDWTHGYNEAHANFENEQNVCNICHVLNRVFGNPPAKCHDCHGSGASHPLDQAWLDFKSAEFHGISNLNCAECHDLNTSCNECHFGPEGSFSPAGANWTHGYNEAHKDFEDRQTVCNRCHTLNRSYSNPPAVCHDCHDIAANHPLGQIWLDPKNPAFHGQSDVDCAACHAQNTFCAQCHFGVSGSRVPAGSAWTHGFNDAHQDFSVQQDTCNACHNLNRSFGNPPAACHDCHGSGLPHPLGQAWLDVKSAGAHGESSLNCSICHNLSQDCTQCHFGADGSKAPAGSGWMHGNNTQHKTFEGFQGVCNSCHELNRSYGNPPAACHDCHGVVLNHPLGQAWLDTNSSSFHGASTLNCADCHTPAADCTQCHFGTAGSKAPAGSDWMHGNNTQHKTFESFQGVCNSCHELNRSYGNPPAACHDCHGIVLNHPLGQAWLDTNSSSFHGASTLNCADCHNLSADCTQCHFGADGSKAPAGSGWNHGLNDRHEDYESYQSVCTRCHNLNRSYGNDPNTCHDCHGDGD